MSRRDIPKKESDGQPNKMEQTSDDERSRGAARGVDEGVSTNQVGVGVDVSEDAPLLSEKGHSGSSKVRNRRPHRGFFLFFVRMWTSHEAGVLRPQSLTRCFFFQCNLQLTGWVLFATLIAVLGGTFQFGYNTGARVCAYVCVCVCVYVRECVVLIFLPSPPPPNPSIHSSFSSFLLLQV